MSQTQIRWNGATFVDALAAYAEFIGATPNSREPNSVYVDRKELSPGVLGPGRLVRVMLDKSLLYPFGPAYQESSALYGILQGVLFALRNAPKPALKPLTNDTAVTNGVRPQQLPGSSSEHWYMGPEGYRVRDFLDNGAPKIPIFLAFRDFNERLKALESAVFDVEPETVAK